MLQKLSKAFSSHDDYSGTKGELECEPSEYTLRIKIIEKLPDLPSQADRVKEIYNIRLDNGFTAFLIVSRPIGQPNAFTSAVPNEYYVIDSCKVRLSDKAHILILTSKNTSIVE